MASRKAYRAKLTELPVAKPPRATWASLKAELRRLSDENRNLTAGLGRVVREREDAQRLLHEEQRKLDAARARLRTPTVALGAGVLINSTPATGEISSQIRTAQALGHLVLARVVEGQNDGRPLLEMWAHELLPTLDRNLDETLHAPRH